MAKQYFETRKNSLEDSVKNVFGETLSKDDKNFTKALESAKEAGQKFFKVNGTQYNTTEQWGAATASGGKVGIKSNVKKPKTEWSMGTSFGANIKSSKKPKAEDNTNDKSDDGKGLDKAKPDAAKKKFDDRKDKDIDNDGDTDASDKFLHKKRAAITKAVEKGKESVKEVLGKVGAVVGKAAFGGDPGKMFDASKKPTAKKSVKEYVKSDGTNKRVSEGDKRRTENTTDKEDIKEGSFAVKITAGLRKALRNPKSIESVERVSKSEVKKALRKRLAGKDDEEEKQDEQWGANKASGGKVAMKASKIKKTHESIVDIQNKKNISVREALAKIWGVSEGNSFNPFKSNAKEAQVPKTKREKTETGERQTKVELNPDIAPVQQTQIKVQ